MRTRGSETGRCAGPSVARALFGALLVWAFGAPSARADRQITVTIPARSGEVPANWLPYPGSPRATVLLPDGYDPARRYPLILSLGGLTTDYASGAFPASFHVDAIVVTPEGYDGWYADWWNGGRRGDPAWESYELDVVLPYVLHHYRILPQRRYHAIIGISMGGLGAAYLGGRLPGFFGSVATLSGFVDPGLLGAVTQAGMGLLTPGPKTGTQGLYPVYGPPDGFYAAGHDPTRLAGNLAQTRVFESTGTGVPTSAELSDPVNAAEGDLAESLVINPMNELFHAALLAAGVDVTYQVHPGGHTIPSFLAEIGAMLAWGPFKPVVTQPSAWTNDTVASSGQLWDIGYRFAQPPDAVVRFRRSDRSLSIGAAGSAVTITTAGGCVLHTPTPATVRLPVGRRCPGSSAGRRQRRTGTRRR